MRAAQIAARAGTARAQSVAQRYAERRRSVVGNAYATTPTTSDSSSPRVVLERDIDAAGWSILTLGQSADAWSLAMFNGTSWEALPPGTNGQVLTISGGKPRWV